VAGGTNRDEIVGVPVDGGTDGIMAGVDVGVVCLPEFAIWVHELKRIPRTSHRNTRMVGLINLLYFENRSALRSC
jgi:hypothetical protein